MEKNIIIRLVEEVKRRYNAKKPPYGWGKKQLYQGDSCNKVYNLYKKHTTKQ